MCCPVWYRRLACYLCVGSVIALPSRASAAKANVAFSLYAAKGAANAVVSLKTLVYSGGAPTGGLNVQFAVPDDPSWSGSGVSDPSGVATCSYTIPPTIPAGTRNVTVTFAGDATHNPASRTTAALVVASPKANAAFSLYASTGSDGGTVTLAALMYCGGKPVVGRTVSFAVDGAPVNGVGVSDSTGKASAPYIIPLTMSVGTHNVTASFAGDASCGPGSRTTAALHVLMGTAALSFSLYGASGTPGQLVVLRSLVYGKGAPVSGLVVQFSVDGVALGTGVSEASGVACTVPAPMSGGTHNVTVRFAGNGIYAPSSRTTTALTVKSGGLEMGGVWAKFQGNAANTGRGAGSGATGSLRWRFPTSDEVWSSPAIAADGTVYIGSNDSYLYAINPADGSQKWSFETGSSVYGAPAIGSDGTVYTGSDDGYVYALDPADGSRKWSFQTGSYVGSSLALAADGTVYVGAGDDFVYALNPTDGSCKWSFETGSWVQSSPAIGVDGTVYVGSDDTYVYALNPADGSQKWRVQTGGSVSWCSPAIGPDGTVYVGSGDRYVYALKPADGSQKWCFETGGPVYSSPAIGPDGTVYIGSSDSYVYALNPADGTERWSFQTGSTVFAAPAIGSDGTVYVGSDDGYLYALKPADGTVMWSYQTGGGVNPWGLAIALDGTVYAGSNDGYVYAIK